MIALGLVIGDASARDAELIGELMLGEAGGGIGGGFRGVAGAATGSALGATGPQLGEGVTGMSQGELYKGCDAGYAKCSKACECTSE